MAICRVWDKVTSFEYGKLSSFGFGSSCPLLSRDSNTKKVPRVSSPLATESSDCCCVNYQPPSASHPTMSRSLLSPEITLLSRTLEVHGSRWRVRGQACEIFQKCHLPLSILSISKVTKLSLMPNLNVCPIESHWGVSRTSNMQCIYIKVWHL